MAAELIDGYAPEWLELEKALGVRPTLKGTVLEMRVQYNASMQACSTQWQPAYPSVTWNDEKVDEDITVRIFTPPQATNKVLPLVVHFHGGGWISGNLDCEIPQCRFIAQNTPCIVVSTSYRYAPEHKFPTPINDCLKGFEWAYSNAKRLGADSRKVVILGGSAGGGLALQVTNRLVGSPDTRSHIQGCISIEPIAVHPDCIPKEYKHLHKSFEENGVGIPFAGRDAQPKIWEATGIRADDPDVFPVLGENLKNFPPTWLASCGKDIVRDDAVVVEAMLKDLGVNTKRVNYDGYPHWFHVFPTLEKRLDFMNDVIEGIHFVLGPVDGPV